MTCYGCLFIEGKGPTVENPLTMKEITEKLRVSYETIYTWRRGSPNRDPLVAQSRERDAGVAVHIRECDLRTFLSKYRPDLLARWHT